MALWCIGPILWLVDSTSDQSAQITFDGSQIFNKQRSLRIVANGSGSVFCCSLQDIVSYHNKGIRGMRIVSGI